MWRRIAFNSLANLSVGVSGMLFQVGMTAITSHNFEPGLFSIWALAHSMASLVPLFSVNLSTIVTLRLMESRPERVVTVMQSSQRLARRLGISAVIAIVLASFFLQQHSVPLQSMAVGPFLLLVLLLASAQVWNVLLQPQFGREYARENNWSVAKVISSARIGGLMGLWLTCTLFAEQGLVFVAAGLLLGSLGGLLVTGVRHRTVYSFDTQAVHNETASMMRLLKAFALWAAVSVAIQYGLPPIMSLLAPGEFKAFYLAYVLNLVFVGTIGTAGSALLVPLTRKRLSGTTLALERLLALAPLAIGLILVLIMLLVWFTLPHILAMWSSHIATANEVRRPLFWLALQTISRYTALVHSILIISAGRPSQIIRPIVLELCITLLLPLPLGWLYGATAFLTSLAASGSVTALYTVWTTLNLGISRKTSRIYLSLAFVSAQALAIVIWILASK